MLIKIFDNISEFAFLCVGFRDLTLLLTKFLERFGDGVAQSLDLGVQEFLLSLLCRHSLRTRCGLLLQLENSLILGVTLRYLLGVLRFE